MSRRRWRAAFTALVVSAACNEGLAPTPACPRSFVGICGTVTLQVPLPDSLQASTDAVFIIAYRNFPTAPESLFNFLPLPPPPIPATNPSYFYTLPLPNGRYEWVVAVWKRVGTLTAQNADSLLREVGFYRDDGDTTAHGSGIVVVNGTSTDSINFVIDFTNMHRICTYFPPCP
ncbi:MAG TPA: hypothetical protein VEU55_10860 [Gemmatimonadales bacterium]|nr:hypothetical protein [Gemmatimonadales bacterium]